MKKSLLLFVFAALSCCGAMAQVDNTLQFVDSSGKVLEDGATVKGIVEYFDLGSPEDSYYQVSTGLSVKNNASTATGINAELTISSMDNGSFNFCFPGACVREANKPGKYEGVATEIEANGQMAVVSEWIPDNSESYGQCTATFRLMVMDIEFKEIAGEPFPVYKFRAYGPSVTVNFVFDETSTGIDEVDAAGDNKIVARYTIDGQQISEPQKGINIVKYENGKTAKILVK